MATPSSSAAGGRVLALVSACFFLSGAAGLIYQLVWMRYLSTVFGTSELAIVTVLVAYMGGLALGASLAARWLVRLRRPIVAYAALEGLIALAAVGVPAMLGAVAALHAALLGSQPSPPADGGLLESFAYLALGCCVLLVPTACMGATLPILAQGMVRRAADIGRRVGWLYALNTFGAVAGVVAGAFVLIPALGLWGTSMVGVAINLLVALAGWGIARAAGQAAEHTGEAPPDPPHPAPDPPQPAAGRGLTGVIYAAMVVSGAVSFAYEILWSRLLAHVLGGSLYAFATMLAAFLAGIAIGGLLGSRLATGARRSLVWFAAAEVLTGVLTVVLFGYAGAGGFASAPETLAGRAGLCALVLMPATICLGATFPLAVRAIAQAAGEAGEVAGKVYSWNTAGAIGGAIGAGYFLIPALEFAGSFKWAVVLNLGIGALVLLVSGGRLRVAGYAVAALTTLAALAYHPGAPLSLLSRSPLEASAAGGARGTGEDSLLFHEVGRSASVVVIERMGSFLLRTNGLPEAEIFPRGAAELPYTRIRWLPSLPKVLRPEIDSLLVVGFGGGALLEQVPDGISEIDVIELEPEVIAANRFLSERRAIDPLADPRVNVIVNDARGALRLTDRSYGAVVSQPSHPWTAGASHLYTREFLELANERLEPGGVFVQWLGAQFVDEELFRSFCATMLSVFPHVHLYLVSDNFLFVGSEEPLAGEPLGGGRGDGSIEQLSGYLKLGYAEDVLAALQADTAGCREIAGDAQPITDDRNLMATHHPPGGGGIEDNMAVPEVMERVIGPAHYLHRDRPELLEAIPEGALDFVYLAQRIHAERGCADIRLVLDNAIPEADRLVLQALNAMGRDPQRAIDILEAARLIAPEHRAAAYIKAKLRSGAAIQRWKGDPANGPLPDEFDNLAASDPSLAADVAALAPLDRRVIEAEYWALTGQAGRIREVSDELLAHSDHRKPSFAPAMDLCLRSLLDTDGKGDTQAAADRERARALLDRLLALPGADNFKLMAKRIPLAHEDGDRDYLLAVGWILARQFKALSAGNTGSVEGAFQKLFGLILEPFVTKSRHGGVRIDDPEVRAFYDAITASVGDQILPPELRRN